MSKGFPPLILEKSIHESLLLFSSSHPTTPFCFLKADSVAKSATLNIKSKSSLFDLADLAKYPLFCTKILFALSSFPNLLANHFPV